MAFSLRNYLCARNAHDGYTVVRNRWIFLVWLQAANFACLPIVASGPLEVYANGLKDGCSAFVSRRWLLQHVPTRVGHVLCITSARRILRVCVAAILVEPCILGPKVAGPLSEPRKPGGLYGCKSSLLFEDWCFNLRGNFFVVGRHRSRRAPVEVFVGGGLGV